MKIVLTLFRCSIPCVALAIGIFTAWVYAGDKKQRQGDSLKPEITWAKDQAPMCLIPSGTFAMGIMESEVNELVKQFADYEAEKAWFVSEVPRTLLKLQHSTWIRLKLPTPSIKCLSIKPGIQRHSIGLTITTIHWICRWLV